MAYFYENTEILIAEDFITKEQADSLVSAVKAYSGEGLLKSGQLAHEFWNGKALYVKEIPLLDLGLIDKIEKKTKLLYELTYPERKGSVSYSYVDIINRFKSGDSMPVHSDKGPEEGNNNILHGVVIYLNDDYEGGKIHYPEKEISIKPKKGSLVIHPGSEEYRHGVTEVVSGERYAITMFVHARKDMYKN